MKIMKVKRSKLRFISGFICGALIFGSIGAFASSSFSQITAQLKPDLPLYINGEKIELENGALYYNQTNYLSLREVSEINGYEVNFDPETQNIDLVGGVEFDDVNENGDESKNDSGDVNENTDSTNNNEKDDDSLSNEIIPDTSDITYVKFNDLTEIVSKSGTEISFHYHGDNIEHIWQLPRYLYNAARYEVEKYIDFYLVGDVVYFNLETFLSPLHDMQISIYNDDGLADISKYKIENSTVIKVN